MTRALGSSLLLLPSLARADAIMHFESECSPGSRLGISNHTEACVPIACEHDAARGAGASPTWQGA